MSSISLIDKGTRTIKHLSTSSDSFLLFAYIALQLTIFPLSWLLAFIGSVILHAVIDAVWLLRLSRRKYKRLRVNLVPPMVDGLAERLGMRSTPAIFVDTTRLDCSAKVIPYLFGGAVLMSSGLLMKAASGDRKAEGIVAHEFAHIQHGDYALFRFLALIFVAPVANLPILIGKPTEDWMMSFAAVTAAFFAYMAFLRRRELYADARAMNAMLDREAYLSLFRRDSMLDDSTMTHPPSSERLHSLENECTVSRISGFIVFFGILISLAAAKKTLDWLHSFEYALFVGLVHAVILLGLELTKPGRNTVPMTYPESRRALDATPFIIDGGRSEPKEADGDVGH